jgi:serine/threonine protein kinase
MLGKTLTGRYKIVKQLGGGGFSQTFIAEDGHLPDRPTCVIKQLKPASSQLDILRISRELFDKEAKVLYRLGKHECIPSLLAHFEEDEEFFLAQELVEGDVLTQEIRNGQCLGEQYTLDFLIEILPTLNFVHRQQVIHRDIKPSNLIRRASDRKIVLIDFGAVKEVSTQPISQLGHTSSVVIGSPGYMPNEQYSGKTIYASDIYALGMIALQALTGLAPNQIPEDPVTSEFQWHDKAKVTPTLANVIDRMVRFDFRQRFQSAQEVLEALQPLLKRSQAQTVFSAAKPNVEFGASANNLVGLSDELDHEAVQSVAKAATQPPKEMALLFTKELAFTETADDLEMSEDPMRSKKLICLVCTGILENDTSRLNNFSFEELLQDLYQQFPDIPTLKEGLVNAVKTIAIPKQRQYLIVAKMIFNLVSKLYTRLEAFTTAPELPNASNLSAATPKQFVQPQNPEIIQVNHLVINAGSAQLVAPLEEAISILPSQPEESAEFEQRYEQLFADLEDLIDVEDDGDRDFAGDFADKAEDIAAEIDQELDHDLAPLLPDINGDRQLSDVYTLVAYNIDIDPQQARLKKLLFYTYQDQWESDLRQLNSIDWVNLLRELVSFMPTFTQLTSLIAEAVQRVSKPAEYAAIADILVSKLEPLYPEVISSVISSQSCDDQSNNKIPFDPQILMDLFDLRLELVRFTNPMRAKILLFSILYYPFNPDHDKWQDLRSHVLDSLLRQLFYAYPSLDIAEEMVWQTARSLTDAKAYEQSASYIIQAIKFLYEQLTSRSMLHPAAGSLSMIGDTESTQASFAPSGDDDTCQFL